MSDQPDVVIRVSANTDDAVSNSAALSGQLTLMGESGFRAAGRLTAGVGGILAAQDNLYNAQTRVNVATISYTLAVREYGAGSIQATKAQDQLRIATEGVTIANDRLTLKYVQFALTTGPAVLKAIETMIALSEQQTLKNWLETASWEAKAAAIAATAVALGLATFGLSLVLGGAAAAATTNNVSQQNNFYGQGTANPISTMAVANQQISSAVRP